MSASNLKKIKDEVIRLTNHNPNSPSYHTQLITSINNAQKEIWFSKQWKFNWRTALLDTYYDKTPERVGPWGAVISVTSGTKVVKIRSGVRYTLAPNGLTVIGDYTIYPIVGPEDYYQYIVIDGYEYKILSVRPAAGFDEVTSDICTNVECVETTSQIPYDLIYLEEQYHGKTSLVNSSNWKIIHRYNFLPKDCVELLDVSFRNAQEFKEEDVLDSHGNVLQYSSTSQLQTPGIITGISKRSDTVYNYPLNETATRPIIFINEEEHKTEAPIDGSFLSETNMFANITVATRNLVSGETPIPAGTYYFGYSYVYGGPDFSEERLLPESNVIWSRNPITLSGSATTGQPSTVTISINNITNVGAEGLHLKIYFAVSNGVGQRVGFECLDHRFANFGTSTMVQHYPLYLPLDPTKWTPYESSGTTTVDITGRNIFLGNGASRTKHITRLRESTSNSRKVIRFFPRVDAFTETEPNTVPLMDARSRVQFEARYIYEPPEMLLPTDQVSLPPDFYQAIVHKVVSDVFISTLGNAQMGSIHLKKAEEILKICESRHISESSVEIVKGNSWRNIDRSSYIRGRAIYKGKQY